VSERTFRLWVAALAVLRIVPALLVLAANGRKLPGLPSYAYGPPTGDTYGFYAAAREFISAWAHVSKPLLALAVLGLAALLVVTRRLWRNGRRGEGVAVASLALGAFVAVGVRSMVPTGAGAVGWPIVWSIPLFPLRAAGALGYHGAFYLGIAVLLLCNVVTVVATAAVARRLVPGRAALVAPALLVAWPLMMRGLEGGGNIVYGSWLDDSGLLLYSEPLSTALVAAAIGFAIARRGDAVAAALAGAFVGFAAAVRISNVTIAALLAVALALYASRRELAVFLVGCAGGGAIVVSFWSLGYATFSGGKSEQAPNGLFSWHYLVRSWRDSAVFDWKMLLLLLPFAVVGAYALRREHFDALVLVGTVVVTAAFYSAYYITALHPRFLFVALPPLFVLIALGVSSLSGAYVSRNRGNRP
jgi:hypothetical protein